MPSKGGQLPKPNPVKPIKPASAKRPNNRTRTAPIDAVTSGGIPSITTVPPTPVGAPADAATLDAALRALADTRIDRDLWEIKATSAEKVITDQRAQITAANAATRAAQHALKTLLKPVKELLDAVAEHAAVNEVQASAWILQIRRRVLAAIPDPEPEPPIGAPLAVDPAALTGPVVDLGPLAVAVIGDQLTGETAHETATPSPVPGDAA